MVDDSRKALSLSLLSSKSNRWLEGGGFFFQVPSMQQAWSKTYKRHMVGAGHCIVERGLAHGFLDFGFF